MDANAAPSVWRDVILQGLGDFIGEVVGSVVGEILGGLLSCLFDGL